MAKEKRPIRADFDETCKQYFDTVYRLVYIHIKRQNDAADVSQEVFFKFLLCKTDFASEEEKKLWLLSTAYTTTMEYFRSNLRAEVKVSTMKSWNLPFELNDMLEALLSIPEKYRASVYLHYCEGYSAAQIAKILRKSRSAVSGHLTKADEALRKRLSGAPKSSSEGNTAPETELDGEKIAAAFGRIIAKTERKEHMLHDCRRDYVKKGYVAKAKARYFKRRIDRYVPYLALAAIAFFLFSWYAVSSGLFTGLKFVHSNDLMAQYDYTYTTTADGNETTTLNGLNVVTSKDAGFVEYNLLGFEGNAYELWDKMRDIGAAPKDFDIKFCTYMESDETEGDMVLTLAFDADLQTYMDGSGTIDVLTGIVKSFAEFYPDADEIIITSADQPVTFSGKEVDATSLLGRQLNITSTEDIDCTAE